MRLRERAKNAQEVAGFAGQRFDDVRRLAEAFGFRLARVTGSHHLFIHSGIVELLNLQEVGGQAKAYQVRQLLRLVEKYNLRLGGVV